MSDRFPPLRPQSAMNGKTRSGSRVLPTPAPIDLTLLAALVFVGALALL